MDDTDKKLKEMIERVTEVYQQAAQESTDRLTQFMENFEVEDFQMQQDLAAGRITQEEYDEWYRNQMVQSFQYRAVRDAIAEDLLNADKIAASIVNGHLPDVYALNVNQAQYEICHGLGYDFDPTFTLYDRFTVEGLIRDGNRLFPTANIDVDADTQYINRNIQNSITQGILQGESIPNIARRMQAVTGMSQSSAIRTARTLTTSAQNAGRVDSYVRAQNMGIDLQQEWLASLDDRTRESHRLLDGVKVPVGGVFPNGCRYPGDPNGPASEIYNCRCRLVAALDGIDNTNEDRWSNLPDDMTYEEWKEGHRPEPTPEETANYVRGNDISQTWRRREDQFEYAIEDVINAQGFDGLPRVVDADEFDRMVNESGFVAQRTYSAADQKTLDDYREQLYNGKFYVDCSTGGAQYGQGMYCAADYNGTITEGMIDEMNHYRSLGEERYGSDARSYTETFTLVPDARIITFHEAETERYVYYIENYINEHFSEYGFENTELDNVLSFAREAGRSDWLRQYDRNESARYRELTSGLEYGTPLAEIFYDSIESVPNRYSQDRIDIGAFAAMRGYDAINAEGHGASGSYTVILNRTAVVFRSPDNDGV